MTKYSEDALQALGVVAAHLGKHPAQVEAAERERDRLLGERDRERDLLFRDMTVVQKEDALVRAATVGNRSLVAWLLAKGVNPNAVGSAALRKDDLEGDTPLAAAIQGEHDKIFEQLLAAGADHEKESHGLRPLMWAACHSRPACLRQLLAAGAAVDAQDEWGCTALYFVRVGEDSPSRDLCARLLLDGGADKHARNAEGYTPLMVAAYHNYPAVAEILLGRGADRTLKDDEGRTALEIAEEEGSEEVAAMLRG